MPKNAPESNVWREALNCPVRTVAGSSILDDLQLMDWPEDDMASPKDRLLALECIPGAGWQIATMERKSLSPCDSSVQQAKFRSPLLSMATSDTTEEVRLRLDALCLLF